MTIDLNQIIQIVASSIAGALAAYAAIRSDLAALKARVDAHEKNIDRIDRALEK